MKAAAQVRADEIRRRDELIQEAEGLSEWIFGERVAAMGDAQGEIASERARLWEAEHADDVDRLLWLRGEILALDAALSPPPPYDHAAEVVAQEETRAADTQFELDGGF